MSVSGNGYFVVSCGQDNVIRLFEKTNEPLVLEDERQEERAQEDEKELATGEETNVYGGPSVLSLPTKKTISSEKAVNKHLNRIFPLNNFQFHILRLNYCWSV